MNSEFSTLVAYLRQWNRRRRWTEALLWLPRGVLAGLLLALVVAAAARLRPLLTNEELQVVALALGGLGLLAATVALLLRRRSLLQQARFADHRFELQERASTAVEIAEGRLEAPPALAQQQLADTVSAARGVDARAALPLTVRRPELAALLLVGLLLALTAWLPNPQADILRGQRALAAAIEEQVEEIEALIEEIEENPDLSEEQREDLLEPLESALQELQQEALSQEEAVAVLSEAEAELRDLSASRRNEALLDELQNAGEPLAQNAASQSLGDALQSGNLAQAAQAAAALADNLPALSADEQAALAESLAQAAAALSEVDPELAAQLAQAAQALREGDAGAAQQALREAASTLQHRAQEQAASSQAQAAAGQLGQGRQELAQGGDGQGQGEGQGEGAGQGAGEGAGSGQGQGQGSGDGQGQGAGSGVGGIGGETGHAEELFVPDFVDLSGEPGEEVQLPAECLANPADCGPILNQRPTAFGDEQSRVPYTEVYRDYRDAAYQALDEEPIPLGLKGAVRDYFSGLEPE